MDTVGRPSTVGLASCSQEAEKVLKAAGNAAAQALQATVSACFVFGLGGKIKFTDHALGCVFSGPSGALPWPCLGETEACSWVLPSKLPSGPSWLHPASPPSRTEEVWTQGRTWKNEDCVRRGSGESNSISKLLYASCFLVCGDRRKPHLSHTHPWSVARLRWIPQASQHLSWGAQAQGCRTGWSHQLSFQEG